MKEVDFMISELEKSDYEKVRPLFEEEYLSYIIAAVIEGNSRGRIWVDDIESPRTAFMWDKGHCFYVAGYEGNIPYNRSLSRLIADSIAPKAKKENFSFFKICYTPPLWETNFPSLFKRKIVKVARRLYRFRFSEAERMKITSGFRVQRISEDLLKRTDLKNRDAVIQEIESMWNSVADFLRKGFGFCSLHNDSEIVSWCTAEHVSSGTCAIGIETVKEFQNQGLATVTASVFVDYCLSRRITPYWDCYDNNIPSLKVAEKVGFERVADYFACTGSFDQPENCFIHR